MYIVLPEMSLKYQNAILLGMSVPQLLFREYHVLCPSEKGLARGFNHSRPILSSSCCVCCSQLTPYRSCHVPYAPNCYHCLNSSYKQLTNSLQYRMLAECRQTVHCVFLSSGATAFTRPSAASFLRFLDHAQ